MQRHALGVVDVVRDMRCRALVRCVRSPLAVFNERQEIVLIMGSGLFAAYWIDALNAVNHLPGRFGRGAQRPYII